MIRCFNCKYHTSGCMYNKCDLIGIEYFNVQGNCTLVKDDDTLNYNDEFIQKEFGEERINDERL